MRELPQALRAMVAYRQFIVYSVQPSRTRPGKLDKFPCDFRTGRVANAHDAQCWTDAATAIAAAATLGQSYGVGFVFTESDPFWFLDIDNCLQADNTWSPIAASLCGALSGAAIEVSYSGRGLHIFGSGRPPAHGCKNEALGLELYHAGRFVALTGIGAVGDVSLDCSAILPAIVAQYFPPDPIQSLAQEWTIEPCPEWRGPVGDDDLIRRALRSQSSAAAFGGRASFADLWTANLEALQRCYPDPVRAYDASSADAALAQHLAFWTGKDCERMRRLMMQSSLVRDKWEREDYLPRTILGAVGRQFEVLTDKATEPVATATSAPIPSATNEPPKPTPVGGSTFVNNEDQAKLFAGCVYILDIHRVLLPGGVMLKPDQFRVAYGGYTFTMDTANERTSRDAWEAFTQNQAYRCPRVTSQCFRPDLAPGAIVERNGLTFVNTYWPVEVPRKVGDATPFYTHLRKVLPDERDAYILLCYMAACVQHKGVKFQWAPLLQGVEGNGKTLFTRCVAEAIGRRYVHWPKASKLSKEFNGWMVGKLFYGVEDIYVPDHKREIIEELKPMITGGDGLEIESKGVDQISVDICGNFMFNSNHKGAVRKTRNDRRFCMLFSAQQQASDLIRDGMTGDYFPKLYEWLRSDGYAIVNEILHTMPIPDEFNPATDCQRAPATTSTEAAIGESMGGVEQEIQEAIAQELPGFCGGWISSVQLERLLDRLGAARRVTHSRRKELLHELGYSYHPALHDGRVNNIVLPDGAKPRLFIHKDSPARALATVAEAAKAYEQANNHTRVPFPVNNS
jgi:hypothetical protein